ncbi:MAG: DUF3299 domain-containing protein [Marinovum sp.]|nr:DUF3299 domain-containing protein [Marinovum sp.]
MSTQQRQELSRRSLFLVGAGIGALPFAGWGLLTVLAARSRSVAFGAALAREITWDDLIPSGLPYSEIIGEGEMDVENDTWSPIYDANGFKFNDALDGTRVRIPGFIIPLAWTGEGDVIEFVLVPYVGACIHVPPPPPNQLVYVTSAVPWPGNELWDAVWVTGELRAGLQDTAVAETGYQLAATEMEVYVW